MKTLLSFTMLCLLYSLGIAQSTAKNPTVKTPSQTVKNENAVIDDAALLTSLMIAKNKIFACYDNYFNKDKSAEKVETANKCTEAGVAELAKVYENISKSPNAIKLLLAGLLSTEYKESVVRFAGGGHPETEVNIELQVELQRIMIIQNQRIIELLEKIVDKPK